MRWLPDRERPGVLAGTRHVYRQTGAPQVTRYHLEPSEEGVVDVRTRCGRRGDQMLEVARGEGGSLEGGRVFIDTHGERLRIT